MSSNFRTYITYNEYEVLPITGTELFKVVRYTYQKREGQSNALAKPLRASTILNRVEKNVAEDYVYKKQNKLI